MTENHGRGFVLHRQERGEHDLAVEVLLEDGGLRRLIAKGGARSTRRFSSGLAPFTCYRFVIARGHGASQPRVDEASVERSYPALLMELRRTAAAGAASVLARDLGGEIAFDAALYQLYAALLERLECAAPVEAGGALVAFAFASFEHAGHPVRLDCCARCGRAAPENAVVHLHPDAGGVVCGACGGGPLTLRSADRRRLREVASGRAESFGPPMLAFVARLLAPHAPRGAEAMAAAAGHWPERPASTAV